MSRLTFLSALVFLSACSRDDVRVYRVAKEGGGAEAASVAAEAPSTSEARWTQPDGWTVQPPGNMRLASFKAGPKHGADVSVTVFPGDAGGILANVNRWRGQLGLEPVGDEALQSAPRLKTKVGDVLLVEAAKGGKAMLGAIRSDPEHTWFYKMTGPAEEVSAARASFESFLKSLR